MTGSQSKTVPSRAKRTMSAAGRKRIAAAQRTFTRIAVLDAFGSIPTRASKSFLQSARIDIWFLALVEIDIERVDVPPTGVANKHARAVRSCVAPETRNSAVTA